MTSHVTDLLSQLGDALADVPAEEVPELIGHLEAVKALAWARLVTVQGAINSTDELLEVDEAASLLKVSADFLYRHHGDFNFTVRMGRNLRFSRQGIDDYIRERRG